jgi:Ca2+-binding RTX toxin-like protein
LQLRLTRVTARRIIALAAGLVVAFSAHSAAAATDPLVVQGTGKSDVIVIGPSGIDLDGDGRNDRALGRTAAPAAIVVRGGGGHDLISARNALVDIVIDGGPGDDVIEGGLGDDTLIGGPGSDVIDGGANLLGFLINATCFVEIDVATGQPRVVGVGGDTVDYSNETGPFTIDLDPNEQHPGTATDATGTDVLQNVEHVIGSPANDTISGDNAGNALQGGAGDDTIAGDAGDDCMLGNDGNDTFDENEGVSVAQGGTGTTNGADAMFGNAGLDDTVTYSARTTRVVVYLESLFGGDGGLSDVGDAEDGADLDGDGFADDDEGDDVFLDVENAIAGSGNDILWASFRNNRADNELTGGLGNDKLEGGAGNDTFHEGAAPSGSDDMDGGTGTDTCDYSLRTAPVSVSFDGGDNDGEAGEGDNCGGVVDLVIPGQFGEVGGDETEGGPLSSADVEVVLGGSGNDVLRGHPTSGDTLAGGAGNDTLSGLGGTDVLNGGVGDDILAGGAGNDALNGEDGTDTADFASAGSAGVRVNLETGTASGEGNDTLTGNENVAGSGFADGITGDSGANVLSGRGGNDAIQGADGDDTIAGGAGADELGGNGGNDTIGGGTGPDAIRGDAGDDALNGGPAGDTILGNGGNDALSGGSGPDNQRGGPGTDSCDPGAPGLGQGDVVRGCEL